MTLDAISEDRLKHKYSYWVSFFMFSHLWVMLVKNGIFIPSVFVIFTMINVMCHLCFTFLWLAWCAQLSWEKKTIIFHLWYVDFFFTKVVHDFDVSVSKKYNRLLFHELINDNEWIIEKAFNMSSLMTSFCLHSCRCPCLLDGVCSELRIILSNKQVSQMRALLAACRKPAGDHNRPPKVTYIF